MNKRCAAALLFSYIAGVAHPQSATKPTPYFASLPTQWLCIPDTSGGVTTRRQVGKWDGVQFAVNEKDRFVATFSRVTNDSPLSCRQEVEATPFWMMSVNEGRFVCLEVKYFGSQQSFVNSCSLAPGRPILSCRGAQLAFDIQALTYLTGGDMAMGLILGEAAITKGTCTKL
jgi:hypothetical protein